LGFLGLRTVVRGFPAGVEGSRAVPSHAPRAHGAGSPLQPRKELSCVSVGCVGVATSRALVLQSHRGKLVQVRSTLTSSYALTPPLWASRCVLLELYVIKRTVLVWPLRTPSLIITPTALLSLSGPLSLTTSARRTPLPLPAKYCARSWGIIG
jgi:hypothetical protein